MSFARYVEAGLQQQFGDHGPGRAGGAPTGSLSVNSMVWSFFRSTPGMAPGVGLSPPVWRADLCRVRHLMLIRIASVNSLPTSDSFTEGRAGVVQPGISPLRPLVRTGSPRSRR